MPRLRPSLFWLARQRISPLAAPLLHVCRDLPSTANEFRWITEHIAAVPSPLPRSLRLRQLCRQRARGIPLQYVLGTQPFGDLEMLCRPGVLIPRPETEAYTLELADILSRENTQTNATLQDSQEKNTINILDLCTGTGCIALQLYAALQRLPHAAINVHGVDISPRAISLARRNLGHNNLLPGPNPANDRPTIEMEDKRSHPLIKPFTQNQPRGNSITFHQADIFNPHMESLLAHRKWHLLVSNPPYISRRSFARDTARAVRNHEPRLALVPDRCGAEISDLNCAPEDVFYARLLRLAERYAPDRVLFEVAGTDQAVRVVEMVGKDSRLGELYPRVEIWRDHPHAEYHQAKVDNRDIPVRGSGDARAVYFRRGQ